jgi:dimethylargininase
LHLLCGCSYLGEQNILIAPHLVIPSFFPGFRFVTIPEEEAYATNALYLGQQKVLIPSGFPKTHAKLEEAGYDAIETEMSEFYKGDGGATCLCCPVYKVI